MRDFTAAAAVAADTAAAAAAVAVVIAETADVIQFSARPADHVNLL